MLTGPACLPAPQKAKVEESEGDAESEPEESASEAGGSESVRPQLTD